MAQKRRELKREALRLAVSVWIARIGGIALVGALGLGLTSLIVWLQAHLGLAGACAIGAAVALLLAGGLFFLAARPYQDDECD